MVLTLRHPRFEMKKFDGCIDYVLWKLHVTSGLYDMSLYKSLKPQSDNVDYDD